MNLFDYIPTIFLIAGLLGRGYIAWRNYQTFKEIRRSVIPREEGWELRWIIVSSGTTEQLFDRLNVPHEIRKRITMADRIMELPPEDRRRVMDAFEKRDEDK